jgi:hypothetical protein
LSFCGPDLLRYSFRYGAHSCSQFVFLSLTVVLCLQTMLAMTAITKEIILENSDFFPIKPIDYGRFLIISLGTGSSKQAEKYTAFECAKWGVHRWLYHGGFTPLIDIFSHASADMVDIHASVLFQALQSKKHYLRIQVINLFSRQL